MSEQREQGFSLTWFFFGGFYLLHLPQGGVLVLVCFQEDGMMTKPYGYLYFFQFSEKAMERNDMIL